MRWDLFCHVVDNYGDVGVCWRLAADLGDRGEAVRLWVDDPSPLAWMAPHGAPGVEVVVWTDPAPELEPREVVVEAFGCNLPERFVARMAARAKPPVWINLEYLSAEAYVEQCHGLPSPQSAGPGRGLTKWFYYPGFTAGTGGLIRERGLMRARGEFDAAAWFARQGLPLRPDERCVSMFCYDEASLADLWPLLGDRPTRVWLTPGAAQRLAAAAPPTARLRQTPLPWLDQPGYDRLLWACELNFVRGEDSFVRALWAGNPFVWQIYPQADGAHAAKLDAFLAIYLQDADPGLATGVCTLWRAWNRLGPWPSALPDAAAWQAHARRWRAGLLGQADLGTSLQTFVARRS